jgi:hypothetical protein
MEKEKSVVEEALLQMKRIEEAISENAKGILASTMKEEISQLVKESLRGDRRLHEQDVEEPPVEDEFDVEDEEEVVEPVSDEEGVEEPEVTEPEDGNEIEGDNEEMPPLNMTQASMPELLRVFKAMGDEDGIIIQKQDDGDIHLVDNNNNTEYLISFGGEEEQEMEEPMGMMENYMDEEFPDLNEMGDHHFDEEYHTEEMHNFDEEYDNVEEMYNFDEEYDNVDEMYNFDEEYDNVEEEENVYEIDQDTLEAVIESFKYSKTPNMDKVSYKRKEGSKRFGKGGNFKVAAKYPKGELKHGVTEDEKYSEMEEEWTEEIEEDLVSPEGEDSAEHTEAARTMTYRRRAERGRVAAPSTVRESRNAELKLLQEKNEEYKKALDFFRKKLDEVAVFNSNLAYSTRLFTEHSTTKQEKINILRRFDNVETIKESKNLYKTIKEELSGDVPSNTITESVQNKVVRTPKTGSSTNLIESKTYENPQFLRMKDLMTKIK